METTENVFIKNIETASIGELEKSLDNVCGLMNFYRDIADFKDPLDIYGDKHYVLLMSIFQTIYWQLKKIEN